MMPDENRLTGREDKAQDVYQESRSRRRIKDSGNICL